MSSLAKRKTSRDDIVKYIEAMLIQGWDKKDAYIEYIDPWAKNPSQSAAQFERKKEFIDLYSAIVQSESHEQDRIIKRVRGKYAALVEANIDLTADMVQSAGKEKDTGKKAQVVRLANETIQALGVISNPPEAAKTTGLNKAGAVL